MIRKLPAALLVLLVVAAPAGAEPAPPEYRDEQVFFLCRGGDEAKVQNPDDTFAWGYDRPHRPLSEGAGCSYVNSGALDNRATFQGVFVGNLRSLAVELHLFPSFAHPWVLLNDALDLHVSLDIDGETVVDGLLEDLPAPINGSPPPIAPDGNWMLTQTVAFSIDGLADEFGQEEGFGQAVRTVALTLGTASPEEVALWSWGTVEVPAGITFNTATGRTLSP